MDGTEGWGGAGGLCCCINTEQHGAIDQRSVTCRLLYRADEAGDRQAWIKLDWVSSYSGGRRVLERPAPRVKIMVPTIA
jgi:hypothetical protein